MCWENWLKQRCSGCSNTKRCTKMWGEGQFPQGFPVTTATGIYGLRLIRSALNESFQRTRSAWVVAVEDDIT